MGDLLIGVTEYYVDIPAAWYSVHSVWQQSLSPTQYWPWYSSRKHSWSGFILIIYAPTWTHYQRPPCQLPFFPDDTPLHISVSQNGPNALNGLIAWLTNINMWMSENFLELNEERTEIPLIRPEAKREKVHPVLGGFSRQNKTHVTNFGVISDPD